MRHPQIVILEQEGFLAWQLEPLFAETRWRLREVRQVSACVGILRRAAPVVFVMELPHETSRYLTLLSDLQEKVPDLPIVVVGDLRRKAKEAVEERIQLTRLLFDLGARYVTFPPLSRELLIEVVRSLMQAELRRFDPQFPAVTPSSVPKPNP